MNIGDRFGGGTVFYVFPDGIRGLVVAHYDISRSMQWGWIGVDSVDTSFYVGEGRLNTDKLISVYGDKAYAAWACDQVTINGFSDWYLPSVDEQDLICKSWASLNVWKSITSLEYWTSSQTSHGAPYKFTMFNSKANSLSGLTSLSVRAIRTCSISDPIGPIKPPAPLLIVGTNQGETASPPIGMTSDMEFSLDGSDYIAYEPGMLPYNSIKGNRVLKIRYSANGINPPGEDIVIAYTDTTVDPAEPTDPGGGLKDIGYALRAAYITKLSTLSYSGTKVPVFDALVPSSAPDYFVVIKDHNEADDSLKGGFNTDVHVTLDIVTRFQPGTGSSLVADNISGQVNALICPLNSADLIDLRPDFNIMNAIRTLSKPIVEEYKSINIFRKVNTYKHEIQQLK